MIEFRSLRSDELEAWFEHCAYVFGGGSGDPLMKELFMSHYYLDPDRDLDGILVAVEDGQILSTVRIFYRKAYILGRELAVGGIGEVSTRPEHQGKGLAYRLLEDAVAQMKRRGTDLSMLRGHAGIYHKLGWRKTSAYSQVSHMAGGDELPYRMRPADFDREIPAIKAIHKEYSKRFNGAFVRDSDSYWRFWVRLECRNLWVIEDRDGKLIGYVSFRYDEGCIGIHEFCVLPGFDGIFDQVASKLCRMINKGPGEVKFESLIQSGLKADRFEVNESGMWMLLRPISAGGKTIDSTEAFIDCMKAGAAEGRNPNPVSDVLFWGIDSF